MRLLLGLALLAVAPASAQQWVDAGLPYQCAGIRQLYTDSASDQLIAVGLTTLTNNYGATVLSTYANGQWDTLGVFSGWVYSVLRVGDTLLAAGVFDQVDQVSATLIAAHYDGGWHSYGDFPFSNSQIRKLRMLNDTLYAVGAFLNVDGHECHGVAKRVGGHWENEGLVEYYTGSEPIISDVCEYQGKVIIGGEINPVGMGSDILQYDGVSWSAVGGGILGGIGSIAALEVYHGELYVGGGISVQDGNAGHGLMRWDGTAWHDVGGSMRDIYGGTVSNGSANAFLVHDDKLYVGGAFGYAGDVHANQFAIWDGNRWCATGDSIGGRVESMTYYHDTLFIACTNTLDGLPANYIGRWAGGAFEQVCGSGVGISELPDPGNSFVIGADRGGERMILGLPDGQYVLNVFDAMGKQIGEQQVNAIHGKALMVCRSLATGLYVVRIQGKAFRGTARFFAEQ